MPCPTPPRPAPSLQPQAGDLGVDAAASLLPVVPQRARHTTGGDACTLPAVYRGQLLDDCVLRQGAWSCLDAYGAWRRCDLSEVAPPPADQQGQLLVAQVRCAAAGVAACDAMSPARVFAGSRWGPDYLHA